MLSRGEPLPHLSNVDESAHQVLVAQSLDGSLSLVPSSIFHYTVGAVSASSLERRDKNGTRTYPQPYNNPWDIPTRQSNNSIKIPAETKKPLGEKDQPKLRVGAHLRHSVGK